MKIITYSEARSSLKSLLDAVHDDADVTVISRRDGADAVVMSLDHYQSILETMHLLSTPANAAHIANVHRLVVAASFFGKRGRDQFGIQPSLPASCSEARKMSLIPICQPSPVARNADNTSTKMSDLDGHQRSRRLTTRNGGAFS